ncbi:hypothetical protein F5B22DRAFT_636792 [Xylaria bambusicola]|uniref:uncharacterized protein n=1 Tax=Xylaria bambusicola TaxID=326684 RepID=UPI00200851DD|nr:uncharacterized protein F5B22DRAFT_636792 [Xylaria bambusicola]KAI0514951.1 hypothetical protein F5B22DRAFT_636792 [Xylaria bambusicola]
MVLPSDRISFASLEGDNFFSAYSTQPTSRLMSIATHPQEQQLPEGLNSAAQSSEPLSSVCMPSGLATSSNQNSSGVTSNVHQLIPAPSTTITARHGSSDTGRERDTPTCHHQVSLPTVSQSQLESHFSKQGMDGIFRNVRTFLAAKRHGIDPLATTTIGENDKPSSSKQTMPDIRYLEPPEDHYLITTDNIAGILDIVIAGVCSIHDNKGLPDCRSLLFARGQRTKPTLRVENIIPSDPAVAEPATTFCSPQPCFSSSDGLVDSQPPPSAPKSTYSMELFSDALNRNGACDVNSEIGNSAAEAREPLRYSPLNELPSRHVSWPQSCRFGRRESAGIDPSRRFSNSPRRFCQRGQRATSEPFFQQPLQNNFNYMVATTPITSFPRLKSRSCTNDWLTPLGLFDDVENAASAERRETVSDLYIHGIDAHSGDSSYRPLPILEEASQSNSTPSLQAQCRSIGVACHKRIRVREQINQTPDIAEGPLDGLRHYTFLPLLDHASETRKRSSQALLQQILQQSNPSRMGLSGSAAGSRSGSCAPNIDRSPDPIQQDQLRAASCSEDAAPHICIDEQRTG